MKITLPTPAVRQWLYGIVVAVLPLLVVLKVVAPEDVPLWLALAGAVLGTAGAGTAFVALRGQRKDGTVE
ncbi:phage holin [Mycolicibacterium sp. XJ775]